MPDDILKAGDPAPDFEAQVIGGSYDEATLLRLSELRGKPVVLYFYPRDNTPGCTTQACGIRDAWSGLKKKAHVLGLSTDSIAKHRNFIAKYDLTFPLISDPEHEIAEAYGVWQPKKLYGKLFHGIVRTTYVIDAEGRVSAVLPKVKPATHVDEVKVLLD